MRRGLVDPKKNMGTFRVTLRITSSGITRKKGNNQGDTNNSRESLDANVIKQSVPF